MNILTIFGSLSFFLGALMLTPFFRQKAAERNMKGIYAIPMIHILIGFFAFLVGVWSHANPP